MRQSMAIEKEPMDAGLGWEVTEMELEVVMKAMKSQEKQPVNASMSRSASD